VAGSGSAAGAAGGAALSSQHDSAATAGGCVRRADAARQSLGAIACPVHLQTRTSPPKAKPWQAMAMAAMSESPRAEEVT
jgi:hypothetical protein